MPLTPMDDELKNLKESLEIAKQEYAKAVNKIDRYNGKINMLLVIWSGALAILGFLISNADFSNQLCLAILIFTSALIALITTIFTFIPQQYRYFGIGNTIDWYQLSHKEYLIMCIKKYDQCASQMNEANRKRSKILLAAHISLAVLFYFIILAAGLMAFGIIPMVT